MHDFGKDGGVAVEADLIVPVKRLAVAKSRLAGIVHPLDPDGHAALVLAMAADTVAAALAAPTVARVLVVASEPREVAALAELGARVVADGAATDLNAALRHGAQLLRAERPGCVVGALQADLPALRPHELAGVIAEARGRRAYCADRHGTGTSLLLSSSGAPLDPRFGAHSSARHVASGAVELRTPATSVRADVDTADDLAHAGVLGLGPRTRAVLAAAERTKRCGVL